MLTKNCSNDQFQILSKDDGLAVKYVERFWKMTVTRNGQNSCEVKLQPLLPGGLTHGPTIGDVGDDSHRLIETLFS